MKITYLKDMIDDLSETMNEYKSGYYGNGSDSGIGYGDSYAGSANGFGRDSKDGYGDGDGQCSGFIDGWGNTEDEDNAEQMKKNCTIL